MAGVVPFRKKHDSIASPGPSGADQAVQVLLTQVATMFGQAHSEPTEELDQFLRSCRGQVPLRTIASQREVVVQYSDEQLLGLLKTSTTIQWKSKPAFFMALSEEIRHRKLRK